MGEATRCPTLAELRPGAHALVRSLDRLDATWRERLQAYGIVPGRRVQLVQRSPVAVVMIEHTQLAFESRLARGILVEPLAGR